ncbi:MAG TPA: phosphoglucosamine mutase [Acidimicrobiales bacterium]|nr:phosphoglucosamine mutase [Acidimicrobiales bacterium]
MSLRFGTDGVRGVAGVDLTAELVLALGRAAATVLGRRGQPFVVGRDTRWSGPMLQAAFSAGLASEGVDVVDLGVLPTPAVADTALETAGPAAVISASHNPFSDNGVKLLAAGGRKLTDDEEAAVEAAVEAAMGTARAGPARTAGSGPGSPVGRRLGRLSADPGAAERYCAAAVAALDGRSLGGLPVVIDCAHGAASITAPAIFETAGANLVGVLGADPDGSNINEGSGSTDPAALAALVLESGAAAGLAFDGDADRVIAVDERGQVVDGDRLLALFATDLHEQGRLRGPGVAVTVMSNLGFHRAMAAHGIQVAATPVGDRHILAALEEREWVLGGEQSGHIVFRDLFPHVAPTGDGALSGLLLLDLLVRWGRPLSVAAGAAMEQMPQVLRNVRVAGQRELQEARALWDEVGRVEAELGDAGRVLLRPSGTEPLVRVMVEAPTEAAAAAAADRLVAAVEAALGPGRA